MTDRTELRRLLDAATPRPWEWTTDLDALLGGHEGEYRVIDTVMALRSYYVLRVAAEDAQLIAAAVNNLEPLLDQLDDAVENQDILIGSVNHYKAERDALAAKLEAVWALVLAQMTPFVGVDDVILALNGVA